MSSMQQSGHLDAMFANHLAFMGTHRGRLVASDNWVRIDGSAPFLSSWTPLRTGTAVPQEIATVRLVPQSGPDWRPLLEAEGFAAGETLAYMELETLAPTGPPAVHHDIRPVRTDSEARAFASVQAAAFLDQDTPHRDWWIDHFDRAARANYRRPEQDFLVAWMGREAAGVLLAVDTEDQAGLYAIATRPEHQRLGLSSALLLSARDRAIHRGRHRLTLQAVVGSYAHRLYARLGFVERFRSEIWRRPIA